MTNCHPYLAYSQLDDDGVGFMPLMRQCYCCSSFGSFGFSFYEARSIVRRLC
ncbi:Hypothetical protein P9303_13871 [Prochlorococcus marinus str. MIT 9303]|uniref:Uncharacterized protein n=1 Tax=Prochlorococcus marinus (strain MIT 9303) TaxID=59922 RepID=A2C9H4_PROM3|nr:Hypothetical protein P9303_13871 [Prochlorococcus marinus str. MIT 9303]